MATNEKSEDRAAIPVGTIVLLAIAAAFYVAMLLNMRPTSIGDAVVGDAIEWLFFSTGLWLALTAALIVGGVAGTMPRPWLWIVLLPLFGVALVVRGDFYSRHRDALPLEPAILPVLIGFYALWARLPALQAKLPAQATSRTVWGAVAAISTLSLIVAANY